jgi:DNA-binding CsgD family transcriptional regulator
VTRTIGPDWSTRTGSGKALTYYGRVSYGVTMPPAPPAPSAHAGAISAAWQLLRAGDVRRANAELLHLARVTAELDPAETVLLGALTIEAALALGDLGTAAASGEILAVYCADHGGLVGANAHLGLGELSAAIGDQAKALTHHTAAGADHDGDDAVRPWRVGAAMALVRLGRRQEAADLARHQAETASTPHHLATGLRALAVAEAGNDPVEVLRRALAAAEATTDRRLCAQLGVDIAGLMLLAPYSHDPQEAVALLRHAERYAAGEGLWPLHTRVVRQLERAGERPRPLEGEALALLTPAERRVARLAAGGLTNREIAESLEVTVKGVEWHLSRVYRKLGIASRDALAQLLNADALAR